MGIFGTLAMLTLYIGNKNYSSWSMRPWVMLKQAGIAFDEVMLRFDAFTPDSQFKQRLGPVSPAGRVPVLVDDGLVVWDTLAIAEYAAERFPQAGLWPGASAARDSSRAVVVRYIGISEFIERGQLEPVLAVAS